MLIGVDPAEVAWKPWSEIQAERIRLDTEVLTTKRKETEDRFRTIGAEQRIVEAALKPFDDALARLAQEAESLDKAPGQPEFGVGHLAWMVRAKVRDLYASGKVEGAAEAMKLLVKRGSRGHRNFRDGSGNEVPFKFEASAGAFTVLDEPAFELYTTSGVVEALASVILDYNSLGPDRRKN